MKRPAVSPDELWAAQAQFGPFDDDVIREVLKEWDDWLKWKEQPEMGMYVAKPVKVEAWRIHTIYGAKMEAGHPCTVILEDDTTRLLDGAMTARYFPKVGDYWVKQEDGYVYLNPKDVFERKYEPLVVTGVTVNLHPPKQL